MRKNVRPSADIKSHFIESSYETRKRKQRHGEHGGIVYLFVKRLEHRELHIAAEIFKNDCFSRHRLLEMTHKDLITFPLRILPSWNWIRALTCRLCPIQHIIVWQETKSCTRTSALSRSTWTAMARSLEWNWSAWKSLASGSFLKMAGVTAPKPMLDRQVSPGQKLQSAKNTASQPPECCYAVPDDLAQDVGQDAAVLVVIDLDGRVDAAGRAGRFRPCRRRA